MSALHPRRGVVSVIVASYNHGSFLERRMDSLLAQTYTDLEVLVIDDCSPDDSVAILRKYERDSRVKLIVRENNGGWVAVSNQGVGLTSGEYVLFANCDDACDPRMIERLVGRLRANPDAGIAFCRSALVDAVDRKLGDDLSFQSARFRAKGRADAMISGAEMGLFLLYGCVISNLSAALFRRDCFDRVGLLTTDYRACSDWEFFFRVARHFGVAYVREPLNYFRQHDATIRSRMKERETLQEYFRLLLSQARTMNLGFLERSRLRTHVMLLWGAHVLAPSVRGVANFPYHLALVSRLDPAALLFLPLGFALRAVDLARKVLSPRRWRGRHA